MLQIIVIGNLGKDPEMRYTPSGQAVTSFSVASAHQYTSAAGEKVKETTWIRVSTWGKQAEACNQYLKKGSKIMAMGRLSPDKTTGGPRIWKAQDGTPKTSYEMTAERVEFLSTTSSGAVSEAAHDGDGQQIDDEFGF